MQSRMRARTAWAHDFRHNPALSAAFELLSGTNFLVNGAPMPQNSGQRKRTFCDPHGENADELSSRFDQFPNLRPRFGVDGLEWRSVGNGHSVENFLSRRRALTDARPPRLYAFALFPKPLEPKQLEAGDVRNDRNVGERIFAAREIWTILHGVIDPGQQLLMVLQRFCNKVQVEAMRQHITLVFRAFLAWRLGDRSLACLGTKLQHACAESDRV